MFDQNQQQNLTHGLRPNKTNPTPKWVWFVFAIAGLAVIIFAGLFFWSNYQISQLRSSLDSQQNSTKIQEENKSLVDKVGQLIILPDDETPTIATVSDLDKLKGQPFFAKAELGDKVLIYAKAKKAILYRPAGNKIVELAPLSDNGDIPTNANSQSSTTPSNTPTNTPANNTR